MWGLWFTLASLGSRCPPGHSPRGHAGAGGVIRRTTRQKGRLFPGAGGEHGGQKLVGLVGGIWRLRTSWTRCVCGRGLGQFDCEALSVLLCGGEARVEAQPASLGADIMGFCLVFHVEMCSRVWGSSYRCFLFQGCAVVCVLFLCLVVACKEVCRLLSGTSQRTDMWVI